MSALADFNSPEMEAKKKAYLDSLITSPEEVLRIMNVDQRTQEWLQARRGRITASNYGSAARHNKYSSPRTLIKQMLWQTFKGNAACDYGTKYEPVAAKVYENFMRKYLDQKGRKNTPFSVSYPGLIICESNPWIACSPDGLPLEGTIRFLLEIKCPFKGNIYPYIPHYYFDQIQGIMGVLQLPYCDFVVWTPEQTSIRRYAFDEKYWRNCLFPRLKDFYMDELLPRLILKDEGILKEGELEPTLQIDMIEEEEQQPSVLEDFDFIWTSTSKTSGTSTPSSAQPSATDSSKRRKLEAVPRR